MATKLHELLAVSKDLKGQTEKVRTDLRTLFDKKGDHFRERVATYYPKGEGEQKQEEHQLYMQTTVGKELHWFGTIFSNLLNVELQISEANQVAKNDVVLDDGTILLVDIPATSLLEMEKRLSELASLLKAIPTLDPSKGFKLDEAKGDGIYVAKSDRRQRTKKVEEPLVLYPATEKHPAQTQMVTRDVIVGELEIVEWTGMIRPADKADMLERVETLRRAVKKARARANEQPCKKREVGSLFLDFILDGKTPSQ